MKIFFKHFLTRNNIILVFIFLLAGFLRFYNFPNRVTFWSEQARSLMVSANYLKVKPSLLGQEYFRQDTNSHIIYSGALFNYSLVPLLLVSNYDPVMITVYFTLLNLFTGFVIYWVAKKIFNENIAIISTIIFLFNDLMIYHSLFIWNYNYLPLIGILIFYFSALNIRNKNSKYAFVLGILSGIGVGLQILFGVLAIATLLINVWKAKNIFKTILLFFAGLIVGNLPLVIFDLRHNFYQTKTIFQYLVDTMLGKSDASFAYYYLLPLWPIAAILIGIFIYQIYKRNKTLATLSLLVYIFLNLTSYRILFTSPTGMPQGLNISDISKASELIATDAKSNFNVAEVLDFDKRAYVLRYYLEFVYNKKPKSEIEYQKLDNLYVLSKPDYNFNKSDTWEINSGGPYKKILLSDIGNGYSIFKLVK